MLLQKKYPKIGIRSRNELAKRICGKKFSHNDALLLINDVLKNFDKYWKDSRESKPEKNKYIRSAVKTPLGRLLRLVDKKVLASYDNLIPHFIFGGLSGRSHLQAGKELLGKRKGRVLYKTDLSRFFEQIKYERILSFFKYKAGCSDNASRLLARICCVPNGPKGAIGGQMTLARGFATSSRLSVWCNLNTFYKLYWKVHRIFKGYDPKIVIYIDDIGVSASRLPDQKIAQIQVVIPRILEINGDKKQKLQINEIKTSINNFNKQVEHLGVRLGRNKLGVGKKTLRKLSNYKKELKKIGITKREKLSLKKRVRSIYTYIQRLKTI